MLESVDCVLIVTDHSVYDYQWIVNNAKVVVDTRNATGDMKDKTDKVVKLGAGI